MVRSTWKRLSRVDLPHFAARHSYVLSAEIDSSCTSQDASLLLRSKVRQTYDFLSECCALESYSVVP